MTYNTWDTVTIPFPFTDRNIIKKRPALIISKPDYQRKTGHLILLMITSAKHSSWYSDIQINDLNVAGLKTPSVNRFKVFSLDERLIIKKIGCLSDADKAKVKENLLNIIEVS
jgi:mRNA interferase MazF